MTRRAVLICPGRGTYNAPELGYLARHHAHDPLLASFDAQRGAADQPGLTTLDSAAKFSAARHTRGDNASALIYAASLLDARALHGDIEVVAVTGNSMGFYTALAAAGALDPAAGFTLANTMGTLMQSASIGGQLIYPTVGPDWRPDPAAQAHIDDLIAQIDSRPDHRLALSIRLGGMAVLAGNTPGLDAFEAAVPRKEDRYPLRLSNHAAFHTDLQTPVAAEGQAALRDLAMGQPSVPLIDGRGAIWWPQASDPGALWSYTLGAQVTQTYDFTKAITVAAREFAPDLFILAGPGSTLGGATAQCLIAIGWDGLTDKASFQIRQQNDPILLSMGRDDQRSVVS